jgi:hypothetical protein
VLIVITDGDDNSSKLNLDNAIHHVQNMQGPIIYSIGLLFGGDLQTLSSDTGGIAFFPVSRSPGFMGPVYLRGCLKRFPPLCGESAWFRETGECQTITMPRT